MEWNRAAGDNIVLEFHDSRIASIDRESRSLLIRFLPAWIHRSIGRPGIDDGTSWTVGVTLCLFEAEVVGVIPSLVEEVFDGDLTVCGHLYGNCVPIPIPIDRIGPTSLAIVLRDMSPLKVEASGYRLEMVGTPEFMGEWSRS